MWQVLNNFMRFFNWKIGTRLTAPVENLVKWMILFKKSCGKVKNSSNSRCQSNIFDKNSWISQNHLVEMAIVPTRILQFWKERTKKLKCSPTLFLRIFKFSCRKYIGNSNKEECKFNNFKDRILKYRKHVVHNKRGEIR